MVNGTEIPPGTTKQMWEFSDELVAITMKFANSLAKPDLSEKAKDEIFLGFISALNIVMVSILPEHKERETMAKNLMQAVLTNLDKLKDYKNYKNALAEAAAKKN